MLETHATARFALLAATGVVCTAATAQMGTDAGSDYPRLIRYVSALPAHRGQTCYGVVLTASNGVPLRVRVLSDRNPQLCHGDVEDDSPQLMRRALVAAAEAMTGPDAAELVEELAQDRLAEVVLPPVSISSSQLADLRRVVIGSGLNYAAHRDEVGAGGEDLLIFPKPVVPTGPYAPVSAGMQIGDTPPRPVLLHDYEVELGFVLLEDVDLHDLPRNYDAFIDRVAFFVANDVSDREPIVLDPKTGYTLGKTRPGYLPIGPWMVHGRYLRPRAGSEGDRVLRLGLEVYEAAGSPPQTQRRQLAGTDQMLRGPWAIVGHMSRVLRQGRIICMRDAYGEQRFVHDANGRIPAGSIILTGTPGGTAIHEPRLIDKGALFVRGGFSPAGARRTYILDMERDAAAMGFLQTGDEVESWIDGLGRQRWEVVASERDAPYGTAGSRACEPGARPQPVGGR